MIGKKFIKYALRWQLGSIITIPLLYLLVDVFGLGYIPATLIFNVVGACVFYPIDTWIFKKKVTNNDATNVTTAEASEN